MTWHALSIPSRTEYRTEAALREHGFNVYIPTEKRWTTHARKKVATRSAIFPGYLFVEVSSNRGFFELMQTATRARLVMAGELPAKIPAAWIAYVQAKEARGVFDRTVERKPTFMVGDEVEIIDGSFSGRLATVTEIRDPAKRVMVLLSVLGGMGARPQPIDPEKLMKREREVA